MEKIIKQLELLGISDKESEIYINLLKLKEATVIQLSKTANIKRTSVYHCLDTLIKNGLVGIINKNDKKLYFAENPKESLNSLLQERKNAVESILPDLKNIYGKGLRQPEIKIYYNINGIKKIFEDVLSSNEKIARYYASDFSVDELLGQKYLESFVKKRITLQIKSLSLRTFKYKPEREQKSSHAKQLREIKFMPDGLIISPYMCIYDNKIVVISAQEKMGFVIESKAFADAQKMIFDAIWNNLAI